MKYMRCSTVDATRIHFASIREITCELRYSTVQYSTLPYITIYASSMATRNGAYRLNMEFLEEGWLSCATSVSKLEGDRSCAVQYCTGNTFRA